MHKTPAELAALQRLPGSSRARAAAHLRGIINDQRALPAADIAALLTGMKAIAVATVTARAEPCISVAHIDNEDLAVFAHGKAERLTPADHRWEEALAHRTAH